MTVVPLHVKDAPQAAHKEGVKPFPLSVVQSPGLASVQQGDENAGPVDCLHGLDVSLLFSQALFVSLANVVAARPIRLLISASKDRLSVTVEPR